MPDSIEGYYLTPWDLGYGSFVKFDHDFVCWRRAGGDGQVHRRKVTLALDNEDVMRVQSSALAKGERAKFMEYPSAVYAMHPFDEVRAADGSLAGLSTWIGYTANEGKFLTLAMLDEAHAAPGTQVSLVWGEPNGGTRKPTVEPHVQTTIKATVAPVPYSEVARDAYADGWRTRQG